MEVGIKRKDEANLDRGRVNRRAVGDTGIPLGTHNTNILVDTSLYEVESDNGEIELIAANSIAENLLAQVDEQDQRHLTDDG